jgi:hypothetical protein
MGCHLPEYIQGAILKQLFAVAKNNTLYQQIIVRQEL